MDQPIEIDSLNETTSVHNLSCGFLNFNIIELVVFGSMLGLSVLIGVYYGCFRKNQNTVSEYMLGGKQMGVFPITISLIASHVSGITLLGVPSEIYSYGTQYYANVISNFVVTLLALYFFIPVFYTLQLNSIYQYLELRFSHKVRMLGSFIFALSLIVHIPVVIYVASLAFNQVTGVSVHILAPLVCGICIFYTVLGGLKGVVWADVLQSIFTITASLSVIVIGFITVGGFQEVIKANIEGGRLELFNMDTNMFARNTFWTVSLGSTVSWISSIAIDPGTVQRFLSLPTEVSAKRSMVWFSFGKVVMNSLSVVMGLIIYTKYRGCDPIATKAIDKSGQLLPYFVMDVAGRFPGINGLFISGVVSTALSAMSTGLNTVAGTIYEDFIYFFTLNKHSDATASLVMKLIVVVVGTICVLKVFIVEQLGDILQVALSLGGLTHGASLSLFLLGMFFPWANTKGAVAGAVSSIAVMLWLVIGAQAAIAKKHLMFPGKQTRVDMCPANFTSLPADVLFKNVQNYTGIGTPVIADEFVPLFYQLSYNYYNALGTFIGVAVGLIVSYFTGLEDLTHLNSNLFVPQIRNYIRRKQNSKNFSRNILQSNHFDRISVHTYDTKL